ncbi:hypothetical protein TcG_00404 [Trypanosoma cruzi]|nr:hypothetical protein TcBrA4_0029630 [Trypanosoma cruzi]RNF25003.1 hypothetical protein TcG_00404 [Trypanosoma cruzi]
MNEAIDEEPPYRCRTDEKASPALCPTGLSFVLASGDVHARSPNRECTVLEEIKVNGCKIRSGVEVCFRDYCSLAGMSASASEGRSTGCVQEVQCVANGVVLVVHRTNLIDGSGMPKMVLITPDMVTGMA